LAVVCGFHVTDSPPLDMVFAYAPISSDLRRLLIRQVQMPKPTDLRCGQAEILPAAGPNGHSDNANAPSGDSALGGTVGKERDAMTFCAL
jgi:hypothetical protein